MQKQLEKNAKNDMESGSYGIHEFETGLIQEILHDLCRPWSILGPPYFGSLRFQAAGTEAVWQCMTRAQEGYTEL